MEKTALMPGPAADKQFEFRDDDFDRVRRLIYQRAGISLGAHKREMVYSRLARRLRSLGRNSFTAYLDGLEADTASAEWEEFVNALTTNLTAFFREGHHFPVLAELVRHRPRPISVWCCAASTGEEPYSIAMTLFEALGPQARDARVLATDIDTQVLEKAQRGIYGLDRVERMEPERLRRFFLRGKGANEGMVRVRPEVAEIVEFAPLNLLSPRWDVAGPFDAIFCRNVMIYFDKSTQAGILKRFVPLVKPGGLLFAGHSENFTYISQSFKLRGQTVYELSRPA
ncbi:CheR family methyltransferase [Orrella sp. JC864]|uniref:CheR family methyltransferase n=1 Tax=Orrella sp. JC864 TaxID=3120298 RepID=UPI00300AE4BF